LFSGSVQGEADYPGYEENSLEPGIREATLFTRSGHYENAIRIEEPDFFIHPDRWTTDDYKDEPDNGPWSQPFSQGCPIMPLEDFNSLTGEMKKLGFEYNDEDTITTEIQVSK